MGLFSRRSSLFGDGLFGRRSVVDRDPVIGGRGGVYGYLTPPSFIVFVVSAVIAAAALLVRYAHVDVPIVTSSNVFDALAIAYAILVVGVLLPRA